MSIREYDYVIKKLREFFYSKNYLEIETQSNLSILSACESPRTVMSYGLDGYIWPMKQTGQMDLEKVLLKNPDLPGVFCNTTSYRDEPHIIEGRHSKIFSMFEFEQKGNINDLANLEMELLLFLGFENTIMEVYYDIMTIKYQTRLIEAEHEERMGKEISPTILLSRFPRKSDPFWNMAQFETDKDTFKKIDVLLYGMETIGSAERSCDSNQMRDNFHNIVKGEYANLLFNKFGKERVERELEEYLVLPMIPRFGAGIGIGRLIRAMKLAKIIKED